MEAVGFKPIRSFTQLNRTPNHKNEAKATSVILRTEIVSKSIAVSCFIRVGWNSSWKIMFKKKQIWKRKRKLHENNLALPFTSFNSIHTHGISSRHFFLVLVKVFLFRCFFNICFQFICMACCNNCNRPIRCTINLKPSVSITKRTFRLPLQYYSLYRPRAIIYALCMAGAKKSSFKMIENKRFGVNFRQFLMIFRQNLMNFIFHRKQIVCSLNLSNRGVKVEEAKHRLNIMDMNNLLYNTFPTAYWSVFFFMGRWIYTRPQQILSAYVMVYEINRIAHNLSYVSNEINTIVSQ